MSHLANSDLQGTPVYEHLDVVGRLSIISLQLLWNWCIFILSGLFAVAFHCFLPANFSGSFPHRCPRKLGTALLSKFYWPPFNSIVFIRLFRNCYILKRSSYSWSDVGIRRRKSYIYIWKCLSCLQVKVLIGASIGLAASELASSFANSFWVFTVARLIVNFFNGGKHWYASLQIL